MHVDVAKFQKSMEVADFEAILSGQRRLVETEEDVSTGTTGKLPVRSISQSRALIALFSRQS